VADTKEKNNYSQKKKRAYRGTVQAEVAALTRQRIIQAGLKLFDEQWGVEITLEQIAERAGVTVQTLLRHFGSKDGLADAISQTAFTIAIQQRVDPPTGDIAGAARSIIDYYELAGKRILRGLAQEERHPHLRAIIDVARVNHALWLEHIFALYLPADTQARSRLLAELYSVTSAYFWSMLRFDRGLSYEQSILALQEMLTSLLTSKG
jgi:AcrR family transcriptional regulator